MSIEWNRYSAVVFLRRLWDIFKVPIIVACYTNEAIYLYFSINNFYTDLFSNRLDTGILILGAIYLVFFLAFSPTKSPSPKLASGRLLGIDIDWPAWKRRGKLAFVLSFLSLLIAYIIGCLAFVSYLSRGSYHLLPSSQNLVFFLIIIATSFNYIQRSWSSHVKYYDNINSRIDRRFATPSL